MKKIIVKVMEPLKFSFNDLLEEYPQLRVINKQKKKAVSNEDM